MTQYTPECWPRPRSLVPHYCASFFFVYVQGKRWPPLVKVMRPAKHVHAKGVLLTARMDLPPSLCDKPSAPLLVCAVGVCTAANGLHGVITDEYTHTSPPPATMASIHIGYTINLCSCFTRVARLGRSLHLAAI